jgi:DNA-binding transcriptional LysR family regulator
MRNMAEGTVGHIRVAALSSASNQVSDCLLPLYAGHPDIQVDNSLLEGTEMIEALRQNTHDFYFGVDTMTPDNMGYTAQIIARGQLELFVNRAVADSIDLSDWSTVARHPFVSVPKSDVSLDKKIMTVCRNRGFTPRIISIYNRAESVVLSVNAGLGVAILPGAFRELYQRPNIVTFPIEGEDARADTVFVWNPDRITDTGAVFRDIVLGLHGEQPAD